MTQIISIYNHNTGENISREMTADEETKLNAEILDYQTKRGAKKAAEEALKKVKLSAYEKLGLTAEEIEALLPTPKPPVIL